MKLLIKTWMIKKVVRDENVYYKGKTYTTTIYKS